MIHINDIYMVGNDWDEVLLKVYKDSNYKILCQRLENLYNEDKVCPDKNALYKALELTDVNAVKVVILGQDPYPTIGDANGLAFSYTGNGNIPKSLKVIFKALYNDYQINRVNTDLTDWAKQGVLLLNTILSIEKGGKILSHKYLKWENIVTNEIIRFLAQQNKPIVFVLWGSSAKGKKKIILEQDINNNHVILECCHPSPLSSIKNKDNKFEDSNMFIRINDNLEALKYEKIDWFLGDKTSVKSI